MASNNVIGALMDLYDSLTFTGKPAEMYFDTVPVKDATGNPITLPTVEVQHHGTVPAGTFEGKPFDTTTVVILIHAALLTDAADIAWGIKYDVGTPGQFLGFDGRENNPAGMPALRQKLLALQRTGEKVIRVPNARDQNAAPVHRIELTYLVNMLVTG